MAGWRTHFLDRSRGPHSSSVGTRVPGAITSDKGGRPHYLSVWHPLDQPLSTPSSSAIRTTPARPTTTQPPPPAHGGPRGES